MAKEPEFTLGIEEEYLLVDPATRDLASDPPETMIRESAERLEGQVAPEFLRSQIEVETRVCTTVQEARAELLRLRGTVAEVAQKHDLAMVAASTHPFASWGEQKHTDKDRYNVLARDLQGVARRLLICGMHVHVGISDPDLRIDLMNQVTYFLPHLLALSTSSPFWQGEDTGLKSYRLSIFDEVPRTGLPEQFESDAEFQRLLAVMVKAGLIEDGTKIWWDIRPSARFPTLEMRITDICTLVDDAITIAALYVSLLHMLYRLRRTNQRWRVYSRALVSENRWRAQRYGIDEGLVDFGKGTIVPYAELLEEILELVAEDADMLGCTAEVRHARTILKRGTSAHRQLAAYRGALGSGNDTAAGHRAVVDFLIQETKQGL
ncbi:MAG: carboxylate-amine ligase [Alphaproteobacteria bacterium]|nr:carboxylate-amine ligase [Alphaproteobacteria bacterium]